MVRNDFRRRSLEFYCFEGLLLDTSVNMARTKAKHAHVQDVPANRHGPLITPRWINKQGQYIKKGSGRPSTTAYREALKGEAHVERNVRISFSSL
jgi:hypothetical protein